mgnify:FL=1
MDNLTRILVPPGIGDVYWVLVKLKSFIEKNCLGPPEITIVSYPDTLNNHLRSIPFLEMFPWIQIGNPQSIANAAGLEHIWNEAYLGPGRSIFPNIMGYNYFIAYNGCINSGGWLETADEYKCDWLPSMIQSPVIGSVQGHKKFMLCFFPFMGTYASHEADFPINCIAESINRFVETSGYFPIFMGGIIEMMDSRRHELIEQVQPSLDLAGRTSLRDVFGLIQGSQLLFGYHSGIPNMGVAMGKPSILLWDNRYPDSTAYACASPSVRNTSYIAVPTSGLTVNYIVEKLEALCKKK